MKRCGSIVLAIVMMILMLPAIGSVANAETTSAESNAKILAGLGIIDEKAEANMMGNISQAEFLRMVSVVVGVDEDAMPEYFNMKSDTDFDEMLSHRFVAEVLVKMLGYESIAEYNYPNGDTYMLQAQKLHLFDGVDTSAKEITCGTAYNILVNALESEMLAVTGVEKNKDGTSGSIMTQYETALYYYMDIYKVYGVLNETAGASIYGEPNLGDNLIKIDTEIYHDNGKNYDAMIGYRVEVYVKESGNEDTIIFMNKFNNKELEIQNDDFIRYNPLDGVFEYYDSNYKQQQKVLSADVALVYNGTGVEIFDEDAFRFKNGFIRLIDNDSDYKYDIVYIEAYEHMVVAAVNNLTYEITNMLSYDGSLKTMKLDLHNDEQEVFFFKDGEKASFNEITRKSVLRVYHNPNNEQQIIRIYISDTTISGAITRTYSDNKNVEIDGSAYAVSKNYLVGQKWKGENGEVEKYTPQFELGKTYTVYLDDLNEIVALDQDVRSSYSYGYLMKAAKSTNLFSNTVIVRLFDEGGRLREYEFAKKVEYNKARNLNAENAFTQFAPGGIVTPQLVAYKLNADGKISKFYTAVDKDVATDEDILVKSPKMSASYYNSTYATFNDGSNPIFINGSSIFWVAPLDADADDCAILTLNGLYNDLGYTVTPYNVDEFMGAELFVLEENDSLKNVRHREGSLFIVTDTARVLSADGTEKDEMTGVSGYLTKVSMTFSDDAVGVDGISNQAITADSLSSGDLITSVVDGNGDIKEFKRWFTLSQKDTPVAGVDMSANIWVHGDIVDLDYAYQRMRISTSGDDAAVRALSHCIFYVYEYDSGRKTGTARLGSFQDLSVGDHIVIKMSHRNANTMVVYKEVR